MVTAADYLTGIGAAPKWSSYTEDMQQGGGEGNQQARKGPSLGLILVILLVAIVIATALAYLVVTPFFHLHPQ